MHNICESRGRYAVQNEQAGSFKRCLTLGMARARDTNTHMWWSSSVKNLV